MGRVGIGWDAHEFLAGRPLILGGVEITGATGLNGHSDADVLIHAICDALLGAAALQDIGFHFPDNDPSYKNADSLTFLPRVASMLAEKGFRIVNIDSVIIAQTPRLSEYLVAMKKAISKALGIPETDVGVKAASPEGLGAIGRSEGIAAQAVALIE